MYSADRCLLRGCSNPSEWLASLCEAGNTSSCVLFPSTSSCTNPNKHTLALKTLQKSQSQQTMMRISSLLVMCCLDVAYGYGAKNKSVSAAAPAAADAVLERLARLSVSVAAAPAVNDVNMTNQFVKVVDEIIGDHCGLSRLRHAVGYRATVGKLLQQLKEETREPARHGHLVYITVFLLISRGTLINILIFTSKSGSLSF